MRIANPINPTAHFYAGKCKGNAAPKHVTAAGESKKIKLDGKNAVMYDSPKSAEYIYLRQGDNWMYIKDKTVFGLDELKTVPVTRSAEGQPETTVEV